MKLLNLKITKRSEGITNFDVTYEKTICWFWKKRIIRKAFINLDVLFPHWTDTGKGIYYTDLDLMWEVVHELHRQKQL